MILAAINDAVVTVYMYIVAVTPQLDVQEKGKVSEKEFSDMSTHYNYYGTCTCYVHSIHAYNMGCKMCQKHLQMLYLYLYPTYDIDQSYRQGSILDIALWLGQYHDIALWYYYCGTTTGTWPSGQTQTPHL